MLSDFGKRAKIRTVCTGQKLRSAATGSRCSEPVVRAIANDGRLPAFTRPPPPRLPAADWEITTALRPSTRRLRVRPPPEPTRSPATVPMEDAHLCLHQERLTSPSGLPQRVRLSHAGREEEQQWLQHGPPQQHRPAVDFGQRLAGGDDKHSQPNAKLANGRFACGARARRLDAVLDLGHQRQALPCSTRAATTARLQLLSAARRNEHGKIGSPPSLHRAPERSVRCAIAHF